MRLFAHARPCVWKDWHAITLIIMGGLTHALIFIISNAQCYTYVEDLMIISGYVRNFTESLHSGILYPRWMGSLFSGAGAPVFVYYSPLAYYISSIFALPARIDPYAIFQLGIALSCAFTVSVLSSYLWLRQRTDVPTALIIALVLLALPSQFMTLHFDVSLALLWASAWFPFGLYCLERWSRNHDDRFFMGFVLILFLIFYTHVPSALLFWPTLGMYALVIRPQKSTALMLAAAYAVALGMSGAYLVPLLLHWNDVQMDRYMHLTTNYDAIFLSSYNILYYLIPKIMFYALPPIIIACAALWLYRKPTPDRDIRLLIWLAGLTVLFCGLLFTQPTAWLWEHVFYLKLLQAPFRLLTLLYVLTPILLLGIYRRVHPWAFVTIVFVAMLPGWQITWSEYSLRRDISYFATARNMMRMGLESQSAATEFKTAWMPKQTNPLYFKTAYAMQQAELTQGKGIAAVTLWQNEHIRVQATAETNATLQIKQHFYPGWSAKLDGKTVAMRSSTIGLILIDIPAGTHEIALDFDALGGAREGDALSLASLLIFIVTWSTITWRYSKQKRFSL